MRCTLFLLTICMVSFSFAQSVSETFNEDLNYFRYAVDFSGFNQENLEQFQDPYRGYGTFRLQENNAPWAGNYYASKYGGIARRWQRSGVNIPNLDKLHTREQLMQMTPYDLNMLSPTEKFDIWMGNYNYPVTKHELMVRGPYREFNLPIQKWEGYCTGMRCAGILVSEPKKATEVTNPDGIRLVFQPADIKALLSSSYAWVEKFASLGENTKFERADRQPNAAVFDLALRYFLGSKKKAFVIDTHLGKEIWNETVVGYQRNTSGPLQLSQAEREAFPWAVSKVVVKGYLETLGEFNTAKSNQTTKALVSQGDILKKVPLSYVLYLNAEGRAQDGVWKNNGTRGVDFAWFGAGAGTDSVNFAGNENLDFQKVMSLVRQSQKGSGPSCHLFF